MIDHFRCNYCSKVYRVRKSLNQHLAERHKDFKGENSPSKKSPGGRNGPLRRFNAVAATPPTPLLEPTPATKRVASTALTPPPTKVARLSTPASAVVTPAAGMTNFCSTYSLWKDILKYVPLVLVEGETHRNSKDYVAWNQVWQLAVTKVLYKHFFHVYVLICLRFGKTNLVKW